MLLFGNGNGNVMGVPVFIGMGMLPASFNGNVMGVPVVIGMGM